MPAPKAAIIAIGSELLSGQIINRNAAWISDKLTLLGMPIVTHVTVDDIIEPIVAYLEIIAKDADLIFVTGGLGPTSDDLTRDAVAAWAGETLVFHEPSWTHVQSYFSKLNLTLPESNKQQCYFPKSATVLENERGTANAFMLTVRGRRVWVLPGPPREIEGLWDLHIAAQVEALVPVGEKRTTRMWRTVGKGESAIAEMVEPIVAGKGFVIAYRAHAPVIETKLSYVGPMQPHFRDVFKALDECLAPWIFEKDDDDKASRLARHMMAHENAIIFDGISQGHIQESLGPHLRTQNDGSPFSIVTSWDQVADPVEFIKEYLSCLEDADLAVAISGYAPGGQWAIGVKLGADTSIQLKASPYNGEALRERNRKAVGALAMKASLEMITSMSQ